MNIYKLVTVFTLIISFLSGCKNSKKEVNEVIVHELSEADMLNPYNYQGESSNFIMQHIFMPLINIDFKTLELVPVLAEARPDVKSNDHGGLLITFTIKQEAVWDNNLPVTAKDVEFSLKVLKAPLVDNARMKPYYEFIEDIIFYDDPKKLTFLCKEKYIRAEAQSGTFAIIPEYLYDSQGLLKEFTINQLSANNDSLVSDPKIIQFANEFNSEKYKREKAFIVGCGSYKLNDWVTNQKIVLEKKDNWWGTNFDGTNTYFSAKPQWIIFQVINDQTSAITALKGGKIDVMRALNPKDFIELKQSEKFKDLIDTYTPMQWAYMYLGINTKLPKFSDKRVRQALAHLTNVNDIIKNLSHGMAIRVTGPIHPSMKPEHNAEIKPYEYNIDTAKQLLSQAGWKDFNGNGILDKEIDGELEEFNITYTFNAGNDIRKNIGLIFQESARKAGINVTVMPQEWSVFLEKMKNHEFEILCGGMSSVPLPTDHKQIFHTKSYFGGMNLSGFGNEETDALIDSIRSELDEVKRQTLNKKFQEILNEEVPFIFLYSPHERIGVNHRFAQPCISELRPGYWVASFSTIPSQVP